MVEMLFLTGVAEGSLMLLRDVTVSTRTKHWALHESSFFTMRCEMKKFMGNDFCHPVFGGQWEFSETNMLLDQNEMCNRENAPETSTVCPVGCEDRPQNGRAVVHACLLNSQMSFSEYELATYFQSLHSYLWSLGHPHRR